MKLIILCTFAAYCILNVKPETPERIDEDLAVMTRQNFFPWLSFWDIFDIAKKEQIALCLSRVQNVQLTRLQNGRVYYFNINDRVTWQQARQNCLRLGMYLATASTQQESNLLVTFVSQISALVPSVSATPTINSFLWTGLNSLQNLNGGYYWDSTGQSVSFTQWANAQPNSTFACGGINKSIVTVPQVEISGWATQNCSDPRGYICEMPRSCAKYVNAIYTPNNQG